MRTFTRIILFLSLLGMGSVAQAQTYGNEWIKYSNTYYKFKVGQEGIYRIPKAALDAAGVPATATGVQFALYRDGVEEPIYVSTNGSFGSGDYIEFWGRKADGKLDKELYVRPAHHPNERISMIADTAAYFLTVDATSTHARLTATPNNIPGTPPAPASYCLYTVGTDFLTRFMEGKKVLFNFEIRSSIFDNGEGYIDQTYVSGQTMSYNLATPNVVNAPVDAKLNLSLIRASYASQTMPMKVNLNSQQVADSAMGPDSTKKFNLSVSSSLLSNNNTITIVPGASFNNDVYGTSFLEIIYPRDFDVSGLNYFVCRLPPASTSQYLEFLNFSTSGGAPRLYDITNGKWYAGDLAVAGKVRYFIDPSAKERQMVLYANNSSNIASINADKSINFTNYSQTANQGDYIIVTHKNYEAVTSGHNYIQDYKDYRSSPTGGSYNVQVAYVEELYDQFAYGNDIHPLAIRRFLQYAYNNWSPKPKDVFMIGKGLLYHKYRQYQQSPSAYPYAAIVPTYGDIGADMDFVSFLPNRRQAINIGRLSAWNTQEVGAYLDKIKGFEAALKAGTLPIHETDLWKKHVLHVVGGKDAGEQISLASTMTNAEAIISDTAYGARVITVKKNTTTPIDQINNKAIDSLVNEGLSMVTFHGHATPNGFELNLNNPEQYTSAPRLPHFLALGCDIAQVFNLTATQRTLSERYIMSATGGSVSMIASNNLQFSDFHARYLPGIYISMSKRNYGKTIGDHHHFIYDSLRTLSLQQPNVYDTNHYYFHLESMILQGDPALPVFSPNKPDYHVAANRMASIPANVNTAADSFTLRVITYNLGRAMKDTVRLKLEHINPAGATTTVKTINILNLYNEDTVFVTIPIDKMADLGLNKYVATIDDNNGYDEISEANNAATYELFIFSDNLVPVYPKEFAIVNQQGITLKASTLNPFRAVAGYRLELDTTELFNSPIKQQTTVTSPGGVIKWTPGLVYNDSTVYYWRAAMDSFASGGFRWTVSSFIYLANGTSGWNQSHFYQYQNNTFNKLDLGADRQFRFSKGSNTLSVYNAVFSEDGTTPWNTQDYVRIMFNGVDVQRMGCPPWGGTIQIMVFDSASNAMWKNSPSGTSGSYAQCSAVRNANAFEFPVFTKQGRDDAAHFLDSIPNGHYVMVRNIVNLGAYTPNYVDSWKPDTLTAVPSLYKALKNMGFTQIDSFNQTRVYVFFRKKGDNSYPVHQYFGATMQDTLRKEFEITSFGMRGTMASTIIGPAKEWQQLKWKHSSPDSQPQNDSPSVRIFGIADNNVNTLLYDGMAKDTSLSWISASQYPNIRMEWNSYDSMTLSSAQLNYWRVLYSPVPEAALNPAAHFAFTDSVQVGQMADFSVAIENLTDIQMDSMLVRYRIIDANSTTHLLANKRYRELPGNDTLHAVFSFDAKSYPGVNTFFVEANPDKDQPEQYHPNNLGYLALDVGIDERNPLLDVTFDGLHILDRDIVSFKPLIKIVLRDENKYLKLDDTSLLKLSLQYLNGVNPVQEIPLDGVIAKFIPASGDKNEAVIEYRPVFTQDGFYQLGVSGEDRSGNPSGATDYKISFEVVNKSTITNVLNYPNPFSTSTAFVFTLTGWRIPSQFKIQILTVTGKVVREITKQELGPIHIGRNITEYKWDGKDQYGQLLGNGVYLYRVVTSIDGNGLEHRASMDSDDENNPGDKFFKNGYGKMYIMR